MPPPRWPAVLLAKVAPMTSKLKELIDKAATINAPGPRVRFQRATRRGKVWFTEAMFPNYLFARFALRDLRLIKATQGVAGVVHFGSYFASLEEVLGHVATAECS